MLKFIPESSLFWNWIGFPFFQEFEFRYTSNHGSSKFWRSLCRSWGWWLVSNQVFGITLFLSIQCILKNDISVLPCRVEWHHFLQHSQFYDRLAERIKRKRIHFGNSTRKYCNLMNLAMKGQRSSNWSGVSILVIMKPCKGEFVLFTDE